jgi:probable F420-dependent oxidoreductase
VTMETPFRFGIVSGVSTRDEWVELARKTEALGYSTLLTGEHPSFGATGPIAAVMAAADATTTLRVGWNVLANDFRNPVLLAQEAATIDVLSSGRLELGIGTGWLRTDYTAMGIPFEPAGVRVDRLAEAVPLLKRLFGPVAVTHTGAHYRVQDLDLMPKPLQQPHPPILVGGAGRRMLTLAAREADIVSLNKATTAEGTLDLASGTPDAASRQVEWVREAAGDRFGHLELHIQAGVTVTHDRLSAAKKSAAGLLRFPAEVASNAEAVTAEDVLASPTALIGTVEEIVEGLLERRRRYGVSYITVYDDDMDVFAPVVARLAGT